MPQGDWSAGLDADHQTSIHRINFVERGGGLSLYSAMCTWFISGVAVAQQVGKGGNGGDADRLVGLGGLLSHVTGLPESIFRVEYRDSLRTAQL